MTEQERDILVQFAYDELGPMDKIRINRQAEILMKKFRNMGWKSAILLLYTIGRKLNDDQING